MNRARQGPSICAQQTRAGAAELRYSTKCNDDTVTGAGYQSKDTACFGLVALGGGLNGNCRDHLRSRFAATRRGAILLIAKLKCAHPGSPGNGSVRPKTNIRATVVSPLLSRSQTEKCSRSPYIVRGHILRWSVHNLEKERILTSSSRLRGFAVRFLSQRFNTNEPRSREAAKEIRDVQRFNWGK